jgi:hypothetical protein
MSSFQEESQVHGVAVTAMAVLVVSTLLNIAERFVLEWKVPDIREKEADLQHSIDALRAEAVKLTAPDTFAAAAKADRKAIALEKELDRMKRDHALRKMHYLVKMPRVIRMVLFVGVIFIAVWSPGGSRKVVSYMDPAMLWPLGRWLSILSGHGTKAGVVGLVPWAILCHRVSRSLFCCSR